MVTQIQLGNFYTSNGRTVSGGVSGSGVDTEGMIKALTDARRLPAVSFENRVKTNDAKTKALGEFQTLLTLSLIHI